MPCFKKLIHYFSFGEMMLWCFSAFTVNDIYGFINWQKMKARQTGER